jgi:hypothetical protein
MEAALVILISVVFDALRDAWMKNEGWWKRHIPKWISFYTPLAYIMFTDMIWWSWFIIAPLAWIAWRLSLRYIAGVKWESMWIRGWRKYIKSVG